MHVKSSSQNSPQIILNASSTFMYPLSTQERVADASFTAPAAFRIFLGELCWEHGDLSGSYLRIRDLTEHRGQALKQQHCFQALQEMCWTRRLMSSHCVPQFLPQSFLLCLFFLSACPPVRPGAIYSGGPRRS